MRTLVLAVTFVLTSATAAQAAEPLFSGPVHTVVYRDVGNVLCAFTRGDKGIPGTSSRLNEDVWVTIHPQWVMIELKNRNVMHIFPADRILRIDAEMKDTRSPAPVPAG
ncbi:MAG: hypothetical protein ACF8TS_15505 [Maioricimonas sp. JB049]